MMKALILDDEIHCREVIASFIREYCPEISEVEEADDVDSGKKAIETFAPDLLFLDIQLKEQTCFDLLDQLDEPNFQIIFTTAYDNYAVKAFKYAAVHYLLKPITPSGFKEAMRRCQQQELNYSSEELAKTKGFYLKTTTNAYNVIYDEIAYIRADGSYSTIYSTSGEDIFTSKKLADYKELLSEDFFRIHHSIIVNMNFVRQIDKKNNLVILSNGTELPISRRKKTAFKEELKKYT